MHYGIVAIGSRGDVQPYLALALELEARGHRVTLMAHENFRDFVAGFGIAFRPLHGSVEGLLKTEEGMAMLRSGSIFAFARYLRKVVSETQDQVNLDMLEGAKETDTLICSLLAIPWIDAIAEKLKKPWAIAQLNLPSTSTSAFPLAALDLLNFPAYNRFTYWLVEEFHWKNNRKPVNAFRRSLGLPELQIPVFRKVRQELVPNLYCFSPALCEKPADWNEKTDITGFLFLPEKARLAHLHEPPDPSLAEWLAKGDAPIYIGFGSIPVPDSGKFLRILHALLEITSHRFLFCQGWSAPMTLPVNPRFFHVEKVNHDWLFPRCQLAVIHGGVGTTAAALKAGIPVVIVSVIADQPWWGKIIEKKGLGVHIPFRRLTVEHLRAAIVRADDPDVTIAAREMGKRIRAEDGVRLTADKLDGFFSK